MSARRLALALALAGCSHAAAPVAQGTVAAPAQDKGPPLATLLEDQCADCHEGRPDRPELTAKAKLAPEVAMRAALSVAANRMPPGPTPLPEATRAQLIDGLCRVGAKDPATCRRALDPRWAAPYVHRDLAALLDSVVPPAATRAPQSPSTMLNDYVLPTTRVLRLDPTVELLSALVAAQRCAAVAPPATPDSCVRAALDLSLAKVPRP